MANRKTRRTLVAAALRAARKARGLTQEELAAAVDCSVETLSNTERGASLPTLELFLDLVAVLDLDVAPLVEDQGRRRVSKARLALEAEAGELARALVDDKLRFWIGTGKLLGKG